MITAPYNFVPLSEKVFFPDNWTKENHKISHDIPFQNSLCGEIELIIEAKTPIFIADHNDNKHFINFKSKEYIPATSIKGNIRNILEIMSFSRITTQDKKYSYRDINNQDYKDRLISKQKHISCGWLYREGEEWKLIELGNNRQFKATHQELGDVLNNTEVCNFPNYHQRDKTPDKKYEKYQYSFEQLKTNDHHVAIFTGTVDPLNDKEFKFPFPQKSNNDLIVDEKVKNTFLEAYYIGKPDESKVWKLMWEKEFNTGGFVPVFYLKENNILLHFGLSLLYKLPFDYSIYHGICEHVDDLEKLDLSESIFGFIDDKTALKGRVQFGHCIITKKNTEINLGKVQKILNNPKPSYYPTYIEQKDCSLNTMNNDFKISGWKRYPVKIEENSDSERSDRNEKVVREFYPLASGAVFKGKIRYHNLRLFELGALLSAITLHGNNDELFHNLGMAKPHGYGNVKVDVILDSKLYIEALKDFEDIMENWLESAWIKSDQLKELFAMMKPIRNDILRYEGFDYYGEQKNRNNDNRDCRENHSLLNENIAIKSINDNEFKVKLEEKMKQLAQQEKEEYERKKQEEQLRRSIPGNGVLNKAIETFIKEKGNFIVGKSYYDLSHFCSYMREEYEKIDNNNLSVYRALSNIDEFRAIKEFLIKKCQNTISDIEKAKLYLGLTSS